MNRYKFRSYSWHSHSIWYPDDEEIGYIMSGANGEIPQQFTGSLDKNGKEIYEGDIVLWDVEDPWGDTKAKETKIVGWNSRTMGYRLYTSVDEIGHVAGASFFSQGVEVIGHIFDFKNPLCQFFLDKSVRKLRSNS